MFRGINSKPFIDLEPFLDMESFCNLHYKICSGLVKSQKKEGNIVRPGGFNNAYTYDFKPTFEAVDEYFSLPEDHEIRQVGKQLGEWKNRDQFVLYLKLALGAYDPYQFVFLKTEAGGWDTRFEEKDWTPDAEHFPELVTWIENLRGDVFKHLGRIIFFKAEHDVKTSLHRDLIYPKETDFFNHRHEFIHLRTRLDRDFYIWDQENDIKYTADSKAIFFNDQDWHNGGIANVQTYSLRIDGEFTDEFRKKIGIDHLDHY